jgi:hypothetical protein
VVDLRLWAVSAVSIVLHIHVSFYCLRNSIRLIPRIVSYNFEWFF